MATYAVNYVHIEGKPFTLKGRPYLWPIYTQPLRKVMLKFARQCEKSTAIANRMLYFSFGFPHFRSLYVTPSLDQTRQFSTDKIHALITQSPILKKRFTKNTAKIDRVMQKRFANGSIIHFRACNLTPDRVRGITADQLAIDEIQDILTDHLPVIQETISHSEHKYMIYAGTPKTFENTLQTQWEKTSQGEFLIKCKSCKKYNFIAEDNIGLKGPICSNKDCAGRARGNVLDNSTGRWIHLNENAYMHGFRIPQLIVPWTDWEEILYKYETYEKGKFYNEVLGLSHDLSEMAVTERQLIVCCDPYRPNVPHLTPKENGQLPFYYNIFMGVDWGLNLGSYTVVAIGGYMGKRLDVLYMEKFKDMIDHMDQIDRIVELCNKFNVKAIGTDFGAGFMESDELRKKVPNRSVARIYLAANQKAKVAWNKKSGMFVANRTTTLSDMFSLIGRSTTNNRLISFPKYSDFKEYGKDFLVIFKDYNSRTRQVYYDHPEDKPDDCAHAVNFLNIIATVHTRLAGRE